MPVVLAPAGITWSTGHDIASHVRTSASVHAVTNGYGGFGGSACATPDPAMSAIAEANIPSTNLMYFLPQRVSITSRRHEVRRRGCTWSNVNDGSNQCECGYSARMARAIWSGTVSFG